MTQIVHDQDERYIVCGSRRWHDRQRIADRLADLPSTAIVMHGNARGADRIAHDEANKLGLLPEPWPAHWDTLGKRAGLVRNEQMAVMGAKLCIAFWDGASTGTAHMIETAKKHGIPVEVIAK